ncbi:hypothetical protein AHIS2_p079 [Acaryochloris phage A-HIS2]|nr:hypothetical protein AHIS2_p079 [Acaryochloris phage A-HIS2]
MNDDTRQLIDKLKDRTDELLDMQNDDGEFYVRFPAEIAKVMGVLKQIADLETQEKATAKDDPSKNKTQMLPLMPLLED